MAFSSETESATGMPATAIAVVGLGFIGARCAEVLSADTRWRVRAVSRSSSPPSQLLGLPLSHRQADALQREALTIALEGCAVVVNCVGGDCETMVDVVEPLVAAARAAGCRRIVHLSTAVVHGQSPPPGCDEATPLPAGQHLPYNVAKRVAEAEVFARSNAAGLEAVALRPGIVYGPGSRWIADIARALRENRLALVEGGRGICNAVHVDNVVESIRLAASVEAAAGEAFLIGEGDGSLTWRQFAAAVARGIGVADFCVLDRKPATAMAALDEWIEDFRWTSPVRSFLGQLPYRLRTSGQMLRSRLLRTPDFEHLESTLLHTASGVPDWGKAHQLLGYRPVATFESGWPEIAKVL